MKILLHTCCGPCSIYPLFKLRQDCEISAFFFNPNIHPFQEFKRRQETFLSFCKEENIEVIGVGEYGLQEFLRKIVYHEDNRCHLCYSWRMEETAKTAAALGFDGFTTTLLYSRYQNHQQLKEYGALLSEKYNILFLYEDYRKGWQYGIEKSKERGMYRQPYCGCIYSEQERYDKNFNKYKPNS